MAVTTNKAKSEGIIWRRFKDGESDKDYRSAQERIFQASWTHKCPEYVLSTPPCQGACPAGEDIRGYLNIARGIEKPPAGVTWQEYAFRRLTEANPFPAVMGRVCPAPCESGCNRNMVEDHVGINSVEHFIGDWGIANNMAYTSSLVDVGLGYIQLGQSATTLSGGEAQRIKLARELSRRQTGRTLYILDEHTTGLHFDDVSKLLGVLSRLADLGNTVIVIEHHLDVIKQADWIIDLGPEGGEAGGRIVAQGTPEQVARIKKSYTGQVLARALNNNGDKGGNGSQADRDG